MITNLYVIFCDTHYLVLDFTNGANKKKLLDRLRLLCELFERPCLVVEKDRVKAGSKEPTKPL